MRDGIGRRRDRACTVRLEHRLATIAHPPVTAVGTGHVELPQVAQPVARIGAGNDLITITHQRHAAQAIGILVIAHARVQPVQHHAILQAHHQQLGAAGFAFIPVAQHGHPGAVGQHTHFGFGQNVTQRISAARSVGTGVGGQRFLAQLPQHRLLVQRCAAGVGHIQRKHRFHAGTGRADHHVVPMAIPEGIPLDQRAIHQQPRMIALLGRCSQPFQRAKGRIGKDLLAAVLRRVRIGIEAMQEALIGPHEHHGRPAHPAFGAGTGPPALLVHIGAVTAACPGVVLQVGGQVAIAPVDGGAHVGGRGVDDGAQALGYRPERVRGRIPLAPQEADQRIALGCVLLEVDTCPAGQCRQGILSQACR